MREESKIQMQIINLLSIYAKRNRFTFFSVPNESLLTVLNIFKINKTIISRILNYFKKMGLTPGISDLIIIKDGKTYGLEIKRSKGKQSLSQKIFEKNIIECGGEYAIANSYDTGVLILKEWGVV